MPGDMRYNLYAAKVLARFEDLGAKLQDGTDLEFLRVPSRLT